MGTIVLYAVIAVAVAAAIVALLVVVLPDDRMSRPARDVVPLGLPFDREVGAEDLNRMRLPVAVRGYRMVDTDAVLDRLSAEIERRDREIADLRMAGGSGAHRGQPVELPPPPAVEEPLVEPPSAERSEPGSPASPDENNPTDHGGHRA